MQRKLTLIQVNEVRKALESLQNTISLLSRTVIGVGGRMYKLETHLHNVCEHGTTDGKPLREPPIPEGWRKAEPEEYKRDDGLFWWITKREWKKREIQGVEFDPPNYGTVYIVPIDIPLTDEDACVVPRLLVMGRDSRSDPWEGPLEFHGVSPNSSFPFTTNKPESGICVGFRYARRATPQEIKQAGLDRPENQAKVEPCRGHDQQRAQ